MNENAGAVFSIAHDNKPVPGCTISKAIHAGGGHDIIHFSLAKNTDISAEIYLTCKLWIVEEGIVHVTGKTQGVYDVAAGSAIITPVNVPVGAKATQDTVYTEITLRKDTIMNDVVQSGAPFALKDLVPYQDDKIVNMDIVSDDAMKFVVMAFDEGTGLSEHAAPGEAIVFALDGEGIIGYEGKEHPIKAGENFKFDKGGRHWVKANGKFKMALLLTLE